MTDIHVTPTVFACVARTDFDELRRRPSRYSIVLVSEQNGAVLIVRLS